MIKIRHLLPVVACSLLLTACGGRSIGNTIDDQFLPSRVSDGIQNSHADLDGLTSHVVVTSFDGKVLLTGQTPRQELSQLAEQAARREPGVTGVYNHLQIAEPTSGLVRASDAGISSRVSALFLTDSTLPSSSIKITTEKGIVYLMGRVTQNEARRAAEVASSVSGVQKVVVLFEHLAR